MRIALSDRATLFHADCRDAIRTLPDNSVDAVVTDPPYALTQASRNGSPRNNDPETPFGRTKLGERGFMGKTWDTGETAFDAAFWAEVLRVLKPGGHVAAFGASRGYHRMACAIEDAGFEIRDSLMWIYGTGFPKSHDVSKGIDKLDAAEMRRERQLRFTEWMRSTGLTSARIDELTGTNMGGHYTTVASQPAVATRDHFETLRPHFGCAVPQWVEAMVDERTVESENFKRREVVGVREMRDTSEIRLAVTNHALDYDTDARRDVAITAPATPQAVRWQGWGTALKPAFEPIVLARKSLSEGTVAANVLRWGTGALNIDACRIPGESTIRSTGNGKRGRTDGYGMEGGVIGGSDQGRWPANVVHDGSDEVVGAFPSTAPAKAGKRNAPKTGGTFGDYAGDEPERLGHSDNGGSAARFFYSAKASRADRAGSKHPTVKPIALMEWLATLITPPGGTILDPFGGSGTTGAAARSKGFNCILCEREAEYVEDIKRRFGNVVPLATARFRAFDALKEILGERARIVNG